MYKFYILKFVFNFILILPQRYSLCTDSEFDELL